MKDPAARKCELEERVEALENAVEESAMRRGRRK
jgi:hypothetical protein